MGKPPELSPLPKLSRRVCQAGGPPEGAQLSLDLYLTNRCELDCRYCFVRRNGVNGPDRTLSAEGILRAVDEFSAPSGAAGGAVNLLGGEPLLEYPLLRRVIETIRARHGAGREISLFTNGLHLDDEKMSFFSAQAVDVILSLDGEASSNDVCRIFRKQPRRSAGQVVLSAVDGLSAAHRALVSANMVVAPETAGALAANFAFLSALGLRSVTMTFDFFRRAWEPASIRTLAVSLRALEKCVRSSYAGTAAPVSIAWLKDLDEQARFHSRRPPYWWERCPKVILGHDGRYYPCYAFTGGDDAIKEKFAIGDIASGVDWAKRSRHQESARRYVLARADGGVFRTCPMGAYFHSTLRKRDPAPLLREYASLSGRLNRTMESLLKRMAGNASFRKAHDVPRMLPNKEVRFLALCAEPSAGRVPLGEFREAINLLARSPGANKELTIALAGPEVDCESLRCVVHYAKERAQAAKKRLKICLAAPEFGGGVELFEMARDEGAHLVLPVAGWELAARQKLSADLSAAQNRMGPWPVEAVMSARHRDAPLLLERFRDLAGMGFKFIGFAFSCETPWPQDALIHLERSLDAIADEIRSRTAAGERFALLRNFLEAMGDSETPSAETSCPFYASIRIDPMGRFCFSRQRPVFSEEIRAAGRPIRERYFWCSFGAESSSCRGCAKEHGDRSSALRHEREVLRVAAKAGAKFMMRTAFLSRRGDRRFHDLLKDVVRRKVSG